MVVSFWLYSKVDYLAWLCIGFFLLFSQTKLHLSIYVASCNFQDMYLWYIYDSKHDNHSQNSIHVCCLLYEFLPNIEPLLNETIDRLIHASLSCFSILFSLWNYPEMRTQISFNQEVKTFTWVVTAMSSGSLVRWGSTARVIGHSSHVQRLGYYLETSPPCIFMREGQKNQFHLHNVSSNNFFSLSVIKALYDDSRAIWRINFNAEIETP